MGKSGKAGKEQQNCKRPTVDGSMAPLVGRRHGCGRVGIDEVQRHRGWAGSVAEMKKRHGYRPAKRRDRGTQQANQHPGPVRGAGVPTKVVGRAGKVG